MLSRKKKGNMQDMKINNHFCNYALDIIDTKTFNSNQIIPKKTRTYFHCLVCQ